MRIFLAILLAGMVSARAEAPKFDEALGLVRSNLTSISEADFNRAALEGLLEKLDGRVELIENDASGESGRMVAKTNYFDGAFGYIRLDRVRAGVGAELAGAVKSLKEKGALKGVVLDLRFASGSDYSGAAAAIGVFLSTAENVLKWGSETAKTAGNGEAADLPLAALVNKETRGAAEALAAGLRDQRLALLIGQPTAGQALVFEDFKLSTGQKLRIGRGKVELPGGKAIEALTPDITVDSAPEAERRWLDDPYLAVVKGSNAGGSAPFLTTLTNRAPRRVTGAEVGRRHREEIEGGIPAETARPSAPTANVVQDPALARALDFLKGLTLPRLREAAKK